MAIEKELEAQKKQSGDIIWETRDGRVGETRGKAADTVRLI